MISHTDTTYQNSRWQYHCIDSPHTSYCFHINSFLPSLSLCFTVLLRPWHQTVRAGLCFVGGVSASANRCELLWGVAASLTNSNNVMAVWWGIDWMEWERACTSQRYMSWTMMQSTKKIQTDMQTWLMQDPMFMHKTHDFKFNYCIHNSVHIYQCSSTFFPLLVEIWSAQINTKAISYWEERLGRKTEKKDWEERLRRKTEKKDCEN